MGVSKVFYAVNHNLLLAKVKASEFSKNVLELKFSNFINWRQPDQVFNNSSFSKQIHTWAQKGSIGYSWSNFYITEWLL